MSYIDKSWQQNWQLFLGLSARFCIEAQADIGRHGGGHIIKHDNYHMYSVTLMATESLY